MNDSLNVFITGYFSHCPPTIPPLKSWSMNEDQDVLMLKHQHLTLSGEMDEQGFFIKGPITKDNQDSDLHIIQQLLTDMELESFQLDLFEEDGRLIQRIIGGADKY